MLLSSSLRLLPLLPHKSLGFQEICGRYIPKMLLCFAGGAAAGRQHDNPCGKQAEEFHWADRKDRGLNLPQEKLVAFFQCLFRSLTSGLGKFQLWYLNSELLPQLWALTWRSSPWTQCSAGTVVKLAQRVWWEQDALLQPALPQQGEEMLGAQVTEVLSKPLMYKAPQNLFSAWLSFSIETDKKSPNELQQS